MGVVERRATLTILCLSGQGERVRDGGEHEQGEGEVKPVVQHLSRLEPALPQLDLRVG